MEWETFNFKSKRTGRKCEVLDKDAYMCGFCRGKGFVSYKNKRMCPACLGEGIIKIHPPVVICAYCNGSGRSLTNPDLSCIVCHGKGIVGVSTNQVRVCPDCKGRAGKEEAVFRV